ncbi:MAG TPA: hypothetical protein VFN35_35860, partial [Ktedonobacteraceae bacterium]|nr:hypothetical protein [Ktedonobacteraceae bacterium]
MADAQQLTRSQEETRQTLASYRLQAEIAAARGLLDARELAHAEVALRGSEADMQQALTRLQRAWNSITDKGSLEKRQRRQVQQILQAVRVQLVTIHSFVQKRSGSSSLSLAKQEAAIEAQVRECENTLDLNPTLALKQARQAEQAASHLIELISAEVVTDWGKARKEINTLRGMLHSLTSMLKDARQISLLDTGLIQNLETRVQKNLDALGTFETIGNANASAQLPRLKTRIELLKQDVFRVIGTKQQHNVAQTIATTLAEIGFSASHRPPTLQHHGDTVRVQAVVNQSEEPEQRDEKLIAFEIGLDGAISYDFSGYAGDSCIPDARRVFEALRQKGLFILDDEGLAKLSLLPGANVTIGTL